MVCGEKFKNKCNAHCPKEAYEAVLLVKKH